MGAVVATGRRSGAGHGLPPQRPADSFRLSPRLTGADRQQQSRGRVIHGLLDEGVPGRVSLNHARALIVNSTDDGNAAAIITARQPGFTGEILALVETPLHRQPMVLAGATAAYTPRHVLDAALAARSSRLVSPTVAGVQPLGRKLQVNEARLTKDSRYAGKTLAEARIGQTTGVTVIGQWVGGRLKAPVTPHLRMEPGGILILVGSEESIQKFTDLCDGTHSWRRPGPFIVAGFGEVGRATVDGIRPRLPFRGHGQGVYLREPGSDPAVHCSISTGKSVHR